ncbi:C4-type zinc ribbon domain-containing protein [Crossiella sp. SN42]|uniref:zinc ribbon domain-containing protein n=1 Tax=Crossiella sp. SN42 TaxID=2944808 RepID=UPI00207C8052|nr:C4-type zinc ribbon domain-containing protein [Crossiella sp. SN42]MCO1577820.1 C4-type zinc ribbon domain-containing protein [Crossiella sp. SN42]
MKADPAVQKRLLDLAEVDAELNRATHRRRTLPELAEITTAEQELRTRKDAVVAVETTLADLDRDAKRLDTEIDQVRAREARDRTLLNSADAKRSVDLQHELETLARRRGILEDESLELMERREAVEMDVQHARAQEGLAQEKLADAQRRRDEAFADLETIEARSGDRRKTVLAGLPSDLVTLYERIRAKGGTGAALLKARRCGACRLELDRIAMSKLKEAAPDEVARCEECGAILVRTAESGL